MSSLLGNTPLAAAYLVVAALAIVWNLWTAARIARSPNTPPLLGALSGIAGLALVPALLIAVFSSSFMEGRALYAAAWVWPAVATVIALQAVHALVSRLAAPPIGAAIAAFDLVLAVSAAAHYAIYSGASISDPFAGLAAAPATALGIFVAPSALVRPAALFVPLLAPGTAAPRGAGTVLRSIVAIVAGLGLALMLSALPQSVRAVSSYAPYDAVRLQERPPGDLAIGIKILPTVDAEPSPLAISRDLDLADSLNAALIAVYVSPTVTNAALDSLARTFDAERDARSLLVAIDFRDARRLPSAGARSQWLEGRVATVERVMRRLNPDIIVPVLDPLGAAADAIGSVSLADWRRYLTASASRARRIGGNDVTVLSHVGGFTAADSALFAWSVSDASPLDGAGLSILPGYDGAASLDAHTATADRWMRATTPQRDVWALETGGYPLLHGERSQRRALWAALAWATRRPAVAGLIALEGGDYEEPMGLRAESGRLRVARAALASALAALGER